MKFWRVNGPEDQMPPERAFAFVLFALGAWWIWQCIFPMFGQPWAVGR